MFYHCGWLFSAVLYVFLVCVCLITTLCFWSSKLFLWLVLFAVSLDEIHRRFFIGVVGWRAILLTAQPRATNFTPYENRLPWPAEKGWKISSQRGCLQIGEISHGPARLWGRPRPFEDCPYVRRRFYSGCRCWRYTKRWSDMLSSFQYFEELQEIGSFRFSSPWTVFVPNGSKEKVKEEEAEEEEFLGAKETR